MNRLHRHRPRNLLLAPNSSAMSETDDSTVDHRASPQSEHHHQLVERRIRHARFIVPKNMHAPSPLSLGSYRPSNRLFLPREITKQAASLKKPQSIRTAPGRARAPRCVSRVFWCASGGAISSSLMRPDDDDMRLKKKTDLSWKWQDLAGAIPLQQQATFRCSNKMLCTETS